MGRASWSVLVLLGFCACRGSQGLQAEVLVADAGRVMPGSAAVSAPLELQLAVGLADGGIESILLPSDVRLRIGPTERLELSAIPGLRNYRVRLFDELDRALVSSDQQEDSETGTRYRILLDAPLAPGSRYTFVLEGQTGAPFTDATGREHSEVRAELQTSGEKPRPAPKSTRPKSAKRHRRG